MNLTTFKKISKQVFDLEKTGIKFDVQISNDVYWQKGCASATFLPVFFKVTTLKQLSLVHEIFNTTIARQNGNDRQIDIPAINEKKEAIVKNLSKLILENPVNLKDKFPTIKFFTKVEGGHVKNISQLPFDRIFYISDTPVETMEEELTYRYIGEAQYSHVCVSDDKPLFKYLDKGFLYTLCPYKNTHRVIITNELTVDVYLCMMMSTFLNHVTGFWETLQDGCFIGANNARLIRIKMEKLLPEGYRETYKLYKDQAIAEHEKISNSDMMAKLISKEIPSFSYNDIDLTLNSATYEHVKIEADDLLSTLRANMVFDDRTDIYNVTRSYITAKFTDLEKLDAANSPSCTFKINNIPITISKKPANTRRYVNDIPINIVEVEQVCFRASCFASGDTATFNKFVDSVKNMSLKYHDVLANGIPMKIVDQGDVMYRRTTTIDPASPRVKFRKDKEGNYLVIIDDAQGAKIHFGEAIKKLEMLNKQVNNKYSISSGYARKDYRWARVELVKILKSCCTFDVKEYTKTEEKVKGKRPFTVKQVCYLSDEHANKVESMARIFQEKAIAKSQVFLQNALKATGSEKITFSGEEAYLVKGKLKNYVVMAKTNEVKIYDTGRHVCIVEPGHQVSVGADATAARIYALANDSKTAAKIGTLR